MIRNLILTSLRDFEVFGNLAIDLRPVSWNSSAYPIPSTTHQQKQHFCIGHPNTPKVQNPAISKSYEQYLVLNFHDYQTEPRSWFLTDSVLTCFSWMESRFLSPLPELLPNCSWYQWFIRQWFLTYGFIAINSSLISLFTLDDPPSMYT